MSRPVLPLRARRIAAGLVLLLAASGCDAASGGTGGTGGSVSSSTAGVRATVSAVYPSTSGLAPAPAPTPDVVPVRSRAPSPSSSPSSGAVPRPVRAVHARREIARLTRHLGPGGVSIEALSLGPPAERKLFRYGASGGMRSASAAKLYILEVLLLRSQHRHQPLDDEQRELATRMIENSDNDAANELYEQIGEGPALRRAAPTLGVRHTVLGPGILWGFNRGCAADFVALLRNLVGFTGHSPLDTGRRQLALRLLAHVESDQRWGVGAAADPGTTTRSKNGWLAAGPDCYRWIVNSVGIVTVRGHRVLIAVLSQHGDSFEDGVELVERLATIAVRALRLQPSER